MRMPTTAVAYMRSFLVVIVLQSLAACAGDTTAPRSSANSSSFSPIAASRALVGATDGRYTFTIDPTEDQALEIGPNHLDIPANAICRIDETPYGPEFWDDKCKPETELVTITAVVTNASSSHPRIDFEPAMRFAPRKTVMLYMTLDKRAKKAEWANIFYCPTDQKLKCIDESAKDRSLETSVRGEVVFRRIKHFSGYIILTRSGEGESEDNGR